MEPVPSLAPAGSPRAAGPGSGWVTAQPRLGHCPRQCCTLPGAGNPISALQTPQNTVLRAGGREGSDGETRSCGHPKNRRAGHLWSRAVAVPKSSGWCPTP